MMSDMLQLVVVVRERSFPRVNDKLKRLLQKSMVVQLGMVGFVPGVSYLVLWAFRAV
jgi:hypothetical protein